MTNQPFPDNRIPESRLDPLAVNFMKQYVPLAQDSLGTYTYQRPNDNNPWQMLVRGDQSLGSGSHQVSGRMFTTRRQGPTGHGNLPAFQQGTVVLDTDLVRRHSHRQHLAKQDQHRAVHLQRLLHECRLPAAISQLD